MFLGMVSVLRVSVLYQPAHAAGRLLEGLVAAGVGSLSHPFLSGASFRPAAADVRSVGLPGLSFGLIAISQFAGEVVR